MANLVEANSIAGLVVYGQQQVDYTVEGKAGCDYGYAVARAALLRSVAVESALNALTGVVHKREQKLSDLGTALSYVCEAFAHFQHSGKNASSQDDKVTTSGLYTTANILNRYGLKSADDGLTTNDTLKTGTISNANANKMQTNIQYMMDKEDNYLQQDMVSLQSYFSRRDQALSLAASLVQKVNNTMSSGIQAIR